MQIVILGGLLLAVTLRNVPTVQGANILLAAAVGLYLLGTMVITRWNTSFGLRALRRKGRPMSIALRRHSLLVLVTRVWLLGGLAAIMLLGYGRWVAHDLGLEAIPLADEAVILMPFLAAVILVWLVDYPFHRAVRQHLRIRQRTEQADATCRPLRPVPTHRQYLIFNIRHHLLFIAVPIGLILLAHDVLALLVEESLPQKTAEAFMAAGPISVAFLVFLFAPLLVVRLWKTKPLADGPLRRHLETLCRRLGLRYRRILLWQSDGMLANAGVMGLIGPLRYILLSDVLLEEAPPEDIEAIFAHEAGHILHHHIFYGALFAIASMTLCALLVAWMAKLLGLPDWSAEVMALGVAVAVLAVGFGWVSRRLERQSDVIAAWACGQDEASDDPNRITHQGAAVFARALQRVGELNGIPLQQRNWRHGSIARRIAYVLYLGSTGGTRDRDDRFIRRLKVGIWLLVIVTIAVGAAYALLGGGLNF